MARYIRYSRLKQQINFINCNNLDNWIDTCNYRLVNYFDVCNGYCNCGDYGEKEPIFQYRWNNLNPNYGYYCEGNNRYYKQRKEVSYDDGKTWYYVIPYEFQKGELYEANSRFCTAEKVMFEYRPDEESEPFCEYYNKMRKYVKNVSFDGGKTWEVLTWNKPDGTVYKEYQTKVVERNSCFCGYEKKEYQFNNEYLCGSQIGLGYRQNYKYEVWREYNLCTNEPTGRVKYMNAKPDCDCGYTGTTFSYGGVYCGSDIEVDGLTITHVENGTIMGNTVQTSEIAFNENLDVQIKFNINEISSVKIYFQFSEGSNIFMMESLDKEYDDFINPEVNMYTGSYEAEFIELTPGEHFVWIRLNNQTNRDNPITLTAEVNAFSTAYDRYAQYEYWYEYDVCTGLSTGEFEYRYPKISSSCGVPIENANIRMEYEPIQYEREQMTITNTQESFEKLYDYVNEKEYTIDKSGKFNIYSSGIKPYPFYGVLKYGLSSIGNLFSHPDKYSYNHIRHLSCMYKANTLLDMSSMLKNCQRLISVDLNAMNTSNVTDISSIFENCINLESANVSNLDTSNVSNFYRMFYNCSKLNSIEVIPFDTSRASNMSGMFGECRNLEYLDVSNFNTSNVKDFSQMFEGCSSLYFIDVSNFDTKNATNLSNMFAYCYSLPDINVNNFDTANVTDMGSMFEGCSGLTSLNVTNFDTSNCKDIGGMFKDCSQLESIDLSNFNTRKVNIMSDIFNGCSSLTSIDISHFNTNNANTMGGMFKNCSLLKSIDVSNFNTYNVTYMNSMFEGCSGLTSLDVTNFVTSKVENLGYMFKGCSNVSSLNMRYFTTNNVKVMYGMFEGCSNLTSLDLSSFITTNVTLMNGMFKNCSKLTELDLSTFDTSSVTSLETMFEGCSNLTSLDLSKFATPIYSVNSENMFNGCDKLVHIKCTQSFKDWCISKQSTIKLPDSMKSGGNGKWEII